MAHVGSSLFKCWPVQMSAVEFVFIAGASEIAALVAEVAQGSP